MSGPRKPEPVVLHAGVVYLHDVEQDGDDVIARLDHGLVFEIGRHPDDGKPEVRSVRLEIGHKREIPLPDDVSSALCRAVEGWLIREEETR